MGTRAILTIHLHDVPLARFYARAEGYAAIAAAAECFQSAMANYGDEAGPVNHFAAALLGHGWWLEPVTSTYVGHVRADVRFTESHGLFTVWKTDDVRLVAMPKRDT